MPGFTDRLSNLPPGVTDADTDGDLYAPALEAAIRAAIQCLYQYRCDMMFPNIDDGQRKRRMERATEVRDALKAVL